MNARVVAVRHYAAGNRHGAGPATRARLSFHGARPPGESVLAEIARVFPAVGRRLPAADPAALGQLVVDLAVAIAARAGDRPALGQVLALHPPATVEILFGHHDPRIARVALALAVRFLAGDHAGRMESEVDALARTVETAVIGSEDAFLVAAAEERGIPWRLSVAGDRFVLLGERARIGRALANMTGRTPRLGIEICTSKFLTHRALLAAGLPTTVQRQAADAAAAIAAAEAIGYPVVVKPVAGSRGIGVACDLAAPADVAHAFAEASRYGPVVVERFVAGDDHRMLVFEGRFVSCTRRSPAALVADGVHSVDELVAIENARPHRLPGPGGRLNPLPLDAEADRMLRRQNLVRAAVPPAGLHVRLRSAANWSQGGSAVLLTDRVHPLNVRLAERVAALFGMDVVGVDMLTTDISRPFHAVGAAINEVQRQPAIGRRRRAIGSAEDHLHGLLLNGIFAPGRPFRIPVVGVLGDAAVAGRIAAVLAAGGRTVGRAGADGYVVGPLRRSRADMRAGGLELLLDDPSVEAAVVELDPAAIMRYGLGRDRIDVLVLAGSQPPADALTFLLAVTRIAVVRTADAAAGAVAASRLPSLRTLHVDTAADAAAAVPGLLGIGGGR